MSVVKPEGGPAASVKPRQKSCVRSSGFITLSAQWPSDGPEARPRRGHNGQSPRGHQCSKTTLTGESWFHKVPPWGLNPGPSRREANGWTTGPVELCMNAVKLQALHSIHVRGFSSAKVYSFWCTRFRMYNSAKFRGVRITGQVHSHALLSRQDSTNFLRCPCPSLLCTSKFCSDLKKH
jgi:hypothetical protein